MLYVTLFFAFLAASREKNNLTDTFYNIILK